MSIVKRYMYLLTEVDLTGYNLDVSTEDFVLSTAHQKQILLTGNREGQMI